MQGKKDNILDILCTDQDGNKYIIEIQVAGVKEFGKKTHEHNLKELSFAFIELPKFNKQEHELVTHEDKWIYFLKNIDQAESIPAPLNKNEFKEACNAANRMTWTEEEFNYYENAIIAMTDEKGKIEFALEQGEAKGRAEGMAAGETRGRAAEKLNTAKHLLRLGKLNVKEVAQITGLSLGEIESIKNKIN